MPWIVFTRLFLCRFLFLWMIFKFVAEPLLVADVHFLMPGFHPGALLAFSAKREINRRNWSDVQNKILYATMLICTVNSTIPRHFLELTLILIIDHAYCNPHIFFDQDLMTFYIFWTMMTLNRHEVMVELPLSINWHNLTDIIRLWTGAAFTGYEFGLNRLLYPDQKF